MTSLLEDQGHMRRKNDLKAWRKHNSRRFSIPIPLATLGRVRFLVSRRPISDQLILFLFSTSSDDINDFAVIVLSPDVILIFDLLPSKLKFSCSYNIPRPL